MDRDQRPGGRGGEGVLGAGTDRWVGPTSGKAIARETTGAKQQKDQKERE